MVERGRELKRLGMDDSVERIMGRETPGSEHVGVAVIGV